MSGTSMTLKPPMFSLASENGPSTTTRCAARRRTARWSPSPVRAARPRCRRRRLAFSTEPGVDGLVDRLLTLRWHGRVQVGAVGVHQHVLHGGGSSPRSDSDTPTTRRVGLDRQLGEGILGSVGALRWRPRQPGTAGRRSPADGRTTTLTTHGQTQELVSPRTQRRSAQASRRGAGPGSGRGHPGAGGRGRGRVGGRPPDRHRDAGELADRRSRPGRADARRRGDGSAAAARGVRPDVPRLERSAVARAGLDGGPAAAGRSTAPRGRCGPGSRHGAGLVAAAGRRRGGGGLADHRPAARLDRHRRLAARGGVRPHGDRPGGLQLRRRVEGRLRRPGTADRGPGGVECERRDRAWRPGISLPRTRGPGSWTRSPSVGPPSRRSSPTAGRRPVRWWSGRCGCARPGDRAGCAGSGAQQDIEEVVAEFAAAPEGAVVADPAERAVLVDALHGLARDTSADPR